MPISQSKSPRPIVASGYQNLPAPKNASVGQKFHCLTEAPPYSPAALNFSRAAGVVRCAINARAASLFALVDAIPPT